MSISACQHVAQLREYVTVLTPSTLMSKQGINCAQERRSSQQTGGGMIQAVAAQNINRERVVEACEEKDFEVVQDADYDAGRLDIVWNINVHPALPNIISGFIILGVEEEDGSY